MKIGVYSDLHISRTSSIMPLYTNDSGKYTTRLNMIINTAKWMYEQFDKYSVDIIVNCGDTFDSNSVKAEELTALSEFYSYSKGIKEFHVIGNHEMKDNNIDFYSTSVLSGYDFIELIDRPYKNSEYNISFLPYTKPELIEYKDIKELSSDILFSHMDIKGSVLRGDYILDKGIDPEWLADNFKLTINGHLHTPEVINTSHNIVQNIGSISSISFVDSSTYIPSICIIDTDLIGTREYCKRINNPESILFRKYKSKDVSGIISYLRSLDNHKYILSISCPYEIRNEIRDIVNNESKVIASRVIVDMNNYNNSDIKSIETQQLSNINVKEEFIKYLEETGSANLAPLQRYIDVINMEV